MLKSLRILFFLLLSLGVSAQESYKHIEDMVCAVSSANYYKRALEIQTLEVDKFKHCTISCVVGIECGVAPTAILGIAKELYDLLGAGTPELADLLANIRGLRLGQRDTIQNFEDCKEACFNIYK